MSVEVREGTWNTVEAHGSSWKSVLAIAEQARNSFVKILVFLHFVALLSNVPGEGKRA